MAQLPQGEQGRATACLWHQHLRRMELFPIIMAMLVNSQGASLNSVAVFSKRKPNKNSLVGASLTIIPVVSYTVTFELQAHHWHTRIPIWHLSKLDVSIPEIRKGDRNRIGTFSKNVGRGIDSGVSAS